MYSLAANAVGRSANFLQTKGYDFLITSDARPIAISDETKHIVRYYDPIPLLHVDTFYMSPKVHFDTVKGCAKTSYFVCDSLPIEEKLLEILRILETSTHIE
mgnify:CR=1 FL=1